MFAKPQPIEPLTTLRLLRLAIARAKVLGSTPRATVGTPQYRFRRREWLRAVDEMEALRVRAEEERRERVA